MNKRSIGDNGPYRIAVATDIYTIKRFVRDNEPYRIADPIDIYTIKRFVRDNEPYRHSFQAVGTILRMVRYII